MARILVTGSDGFVGRHVVDELIAHDHAVVAVVARDGDGTPRPGVERCVQADLMDPVATAAIDLTDIDGVIHLAGLAAVGASFAEPLRWISTNVGIQINILENALAQKTHLRFLVVSSCTVYATTTDLPLTESSAILPDSPYAVSKIGQEQMGHYYRVRGLDTIVARPYNHLGPGQGTGFLAPDLARQIVAVERGEADTIQVGNLDAERDYSDVRDIARAYRRLIEAGTPGETYNVCTNVATSGHRILEQLLALTDAHPTIERDPARMRPSDSPKVVGSHDKLTADTGWRPEIPLAQTLADTLEDWRSR